MVFMKIIKTLKGEYSCSSDTLTSGATLELPKDVKAKIYHKHSTNGLLYQLEHKAWEVTFNQETKDALGKVKFFFPQRRDTYIKISQPVPGFNFKNVPNPEVQLETYIIDEPKIRDKSEFKYDVGLKKAIFEETIKFGRVDAKTRHKVEFGVDSISKIDGMKVKYELERDSGWPHEFDLTYSKPKGPAAKIEIKPISKFKISTKTEFKSKMCGVELDFKPSDKIQFEAKAATPYSGTDKFTFKPTLSCKFDL